MASCVPQDLGRWSRHDGKHVPHLDQAGDPADKKTNLDEDRRTVGVIGVVTRKNQIGRAWYFRLQREFDRTGTFLLGKDVQLGFYDDDFMAQGKPAPKPDELPAKVGNRPDAGYRIYGALRDADDRRSRRTLRS